MSAAVDNTLHGLGGALIAALIYLPQLWWHWWVFISIPLVSLGFGMLREQAQHDPGKGHSLHERYIKWINGPRMLEASSWGIGGAVVMEGIVLPVVLLVLK